MNHVKMNQTPFGGLMGVGRRDISPPAGIFCRNWGAAEHDKAEGLHRPLTVTVLAIRRDEKSPPLLLVAIDLGWFTTPQTEWLLREPLLRTFGLEESRVMVCLSHSHATPSMAAADADRPGGELIPAYADHVVGQLVEAAHDAMNTALPAKLTWRYGRCDLATNRDFPEPGTARILTGWNPDEPADDTLLVGRVTRDGDDAVIATLVNYACHPTTLAWQNRLVSPDYVGAMRQVVEGCFDNAPCLFLQGASGELSPAQQYTGDAEVADHHGRRLGHAAVSTLLGMDPPGQALTFAGAVESGAVLAVWTPRAIASDRTMESIQARMPMPLKDRPSLEALDRELAQCKDRALAERLLRKRRRDAYFKDASTFEVSLHAWRLGPAILMGQPLEAYSAWQLRLRESHPGRPMVMINLVNGSLGYVVPPELCNPGLYASWQSLFDRGSFPILMETSQAVALKLLEKEEA